MQQSLEESRYSLRSLLTVCRLDRITQAAEELSKGTGKICIPAQADVRNPNELKEAVRKTVEKFGRIDLAICDQSKLACPSFSGQLKIDFGHSPIGAGNFLAVQERVQDRR